MVSNMVSAPILEAANAASMPAWPAPITMISHLPMQNLANMPCRMSAAADCAGQFADPREPLADLLGDQFGGVDVCRDSMLLIGFHLFHQLFQQGLLPDIDDRSHVGFRNVGHNPLRNAVTASRLFRVFGR